MVKKSPNAGRSILEILWEELDSIMDRLMGEGKPGTSEGEFGCELGDPEQWQKYGEERGQGQGVAYCIAVMENPYAPDVPGIKVRAMNRWNERQKE
jgi:hypothetical protein